MEEPAAIVGRSSRVNEEVDVAAAWDASVPVLRRASGGAAIVAGPGCLMYSVVLRYEGREHLRLLDQVHRHVLGIVCSALEGKVSGVEHVGTSDLAVGGRKFSGNSLRCKRDNLLYHGTLLYAFDLNLIQRLLKIPPRQPSYRSGRSHSDFVANLTITASVLRQSVAESFGAEEPLVDWPRDRTTELAASRYSQPTWNHQR
jgi:lipoate-protein ligase A